MANLYNDSRPPVTKEEIYTPYPFPPPPDILQLEVDTINVEEGRVDINTFPPDYQIRINNFYRFSATRYSSNDGTIAKMTPDTLDLI